MHASRSLIRPWALLALAGAVALGAAALGPGRGRSTPASATSTSPDPVTLPDSLAFDIEYAGLGAEGVDLIWRGSAAGPVPARVTIRMEYAGNPQERAMPVWPVNVRLFYSADDLRNSFAAELSGSMNWHSGEMRVTGLVSDGVRRDATLEQHVLLRPSSLSGSATLVFLPRIALDGAAALGF